MLKLRGLNNRICYNPLWIMHIGLYNKIREKNKMKKQINKLERKIMNSHDYTMFVVIIMFAIIIL